MDFENNHDRDGKYSIPKSITYATGVFKVLYKLA